MKQTAIEWLQQALMTKEDADNYNQWAFNKAKAMEQEQIIEAHGNKKKLSRGVTNYEYTLTGEEYYNETFKSK